jgi:type II secretion system protein G
MWCHSNLRGGLARSLSLDHNACRRGIPMRTRGFTLIELLIVVAIIAILAAIAVPNFLEAQTRAKVSRTKADMRSVATAIEAYRIDANHYMPDFDDGGVFAQTLISRLIPLTTPVAYMTSLPEDIFGRQFAAMASSNAAPYHQGGVASNPLISPVVYDYAEQEIGMGDSEAVWAEISQSPFTVKWALNSPGPDLIQTYLGFTNLVIYDPTNGTISFGQIIRTSLSADDSPRNP